jgi:hypothetical protein
MKESKRAGDILMWVRKERTWRHMFLTLIRNIIGKGLGQPWWNMVVVGDVKRRR